MFMNKKCCCEANRCMSNPCMNTGYMNNPCTEYCNMDPVMEKPVEKCIQKDIIHEVQHICPINTKVINNHIYKHVYVPQYSCCEEDVVTNMDECPCNMPNWQ